MYMYMYYVCDYFTKPKRVHVHLHQGNHLRVDAFPYVGTCTCVYTSLSIHVQPYGINLQSSHGHLSYITDACTGTCTT